MFNAQAVGVARILSHQPGPWYTPVLGWGLRFPEAISVSEMEGGSGGKGRELKLLERKSLTVFPKGRWKGVY